MFLTTALHSFAGLAANISILRGLMRQKIDFAPTNANNVRTSERLMGFAKGIVFWFITGSTILLGMSLRNQLLFFSLNGLWIFFWGISPLTLLFFHRDQLRRG